MKELRKKNNFKNVKKNISIYYLALVLPRCTTPSALIEYRCKSFFKPPTKYEEIESLENIILRINIFNELKKRENLLLKRKRSFIKRNRKEEEVEILKELEQKKIKELEFKYFILLRMINYLIIGSVLILFLLFICYCNKDNFSNLLTNYKSKLNVKRPHHPKWYEDIPENHPEVLDLIKRTEEQSKRVPTYTPTGFKKIKTPPEVQDYLLNVATTVDREPERSNNIFRRTSSGLPPRITNS